MPTIKSRETRRAKYLDADSFGLGSIIGFPMCCQPATLCTIIHTRSSAPHIQTLPIITALPIILCTCIATPPVIIPFVNILHIGPQYSRNAALTAGQTIGLEIWSVEAECDVDSTVGRFRIWSIGARRVSWSVEVYSRLRWDGMFEPFLA